MGKNLENIKISIVIPALNEAENIQQAIATTQPSADIEVIVVDGGSQDDTVAIAQSLGVKVISSFPGRAVQMNAGATLAMGEILLFLHADTRLPVGFDEIIRAALQQPGVIAGAFALRINADLAGLRLVEKGVYWRSRLLQMPYGDQAIFMTKAVFQQVGGFPELPIMEDFELMRRLKRVGKIAILPVAVVTSARRWLQKGVFKTTLINQVVIVAYLLGVAPAQLRSWYRQGRFFKF
ncbi:TIGR04283 family arsenosugar biosynthesis glycosyltransferase [Anabaena subtropica]|uniref:4,4'-diaponeurosporenoate glycosyltransferase n=1 Tax=Anabaena subtropica FACHB-260 TaxID=2692884 RepID=A0ABR8CL81_9NOST|nr:TIGR04283 family arsenosugar biosynthesis glycosyltransferase [Anabaena subtropica]MBD2343265.1 TIGR04283 family arsenosugar biosynthesis glycosyltransferase [Anabaena subtropica FACHB-260]